MCVVIHNSKRPYAFFVIILYSLMTCCYRFCINMTIAIYMSFNKDLIKSDKTVFLQKIVTEMA